MHKDKKKKYEPPVPTRVGKKKKKTKGPDAASKLPLGKRSACLGPYGLPALQHAEPRPPLAAGGVQSTDACTAGPSILLVLINLKREDKVMVIQDEFRTFMYKGERET